MLAGIESPSTFDNFFFVHLSQVVHPEHNGPFHSCRSVITRCIQLAWFFVHALKIFTYAGPLFVIFYQNLLRIKMITNAGQHDIGFKNSNQIKCRYFAQMRFGIVMEHVCIRSLEKCLGCGRDRFRVFSSLKKKLYGNSASPIRVKRSRFDFIDSYRCVGFIAMFFQLLAPVVGHYIAKSTSFVFIGIFVLAWRNCRRITAFVTIHIERQHSLDSRE